MFLNNKYRIVFILAAVAVLMVSLVLTFAGESHSELTDTTIGSQLPAQNISPTFNENIATPIRVIEDDRGNNPANNIAECQQTGVVPIIDYSETQQEQLKEQLAYNMEQNGSFESRLTSLLSGSTLSLEQQLVQLRELSKEHPENKLASYDFLSFCTTQANSCDSSEITRSAALDYQNGAVWMLVASYELANSSPERAEAAMLEAAHAPLYNEYWAEHFSIFESAFAQAGLNDDQLKLIGTIGYGALIPLPNFKPLVTYCENAGPDEADKLDICLILGRRMMESQSTIVGYLIGLSIQEKVQSKYGREGKLPELANLRKEFEILYKQIGKAMDLFWRNQRRLTDWQNKHKAHGEVEAYRFAVGEAIRLSSDPDFDPCETNW